MSDDEQDLGGFDPTTPAPVRKPSKARKPDSRNEAGPSTKPTKRRKEAPKSPTSNPDVELIDDSSNPFDFSNLNGDNKVQRSNREDAAAPVANGRTTTKAKAKPKMKSASRTTIPVPMDVDLIEVPDGTEELEPRRQFKTKPSNRDRHTKATGMAEVDEIARLKEQLQRYEQQITTLSSQLEEVFNTRQTEPEMLLRQYQAEFEVQLKAHEELIKEQNIQLAMKEPLMRSGNSTVLNLLTREAADEEKRAVESEVQRWKSVAEQKQREIRSKDERIAELQRSLTDSQAELKAEIERSATLAKASRAPPSASRIGGRTGIDDPKHGEVIRFYEDITNLLIPMMKAAPGQYLGLDEWVLTCVYTWSDENADNSSDAAQKSLNFSLRLCHEPDPNESSSSQLITSKDQLISMVYYNPQNLENEPEDFVESLDFLKESFSIGRNQLPLFLKTLHTKMTEAMMEGNDADSIQEVEAP